MDVLPEVFRSESEFSGVILARGRRMTPGGPRRRRWRTCAHYLSDLQVHGQVHTLTTGPVASAAIRRVKPGDEDTERTRIPSRQRSVSRTRLALGILAVALAAV